MWLLIVFLHGFKGSVSGPGPFTKLMYRIDDLYLRRRRSNESFLYFMSVLDASMIRIAFEVL